MKMNQEQLRKEAFEQIYLDAKTRGIIATLGEAGAFKFGIEKGIEWEAEREKWISVEDGLPENRQQVVFYRNSVSEGVLLGVYKHKLFHSDLIMYSGVTHWMPISPPKTSKQ